MIFIEVLRNVTDCKERSAMSLESVRTIGLIAVCVCVCVCNPHCRLKCLASLLLCLLAALLTRRHSLSPNKANHRNTALRITWARFTCTVEYIVSDPRQIRSTITFPRCTFAVFFFPLRFRLLTADLRHTGRDRWHS